ncbi:MAG TPA: AAA family ATPase [Polyangiaceae bacterium LLY-WYZ-15_(1-7)]|nr:AAA family ATPase [Polyangiaceae bacterium LLY-WYZ-15_(1-7)]HJL27320.1 AAA family ATPase [Polyangiaceae bacterium LLY-WYZ-15_(1-7)]HJL33122.1 AAA family ATPase [Polyangiaceae bacterium LLY-WYZ-15_(1-7)]
MVADSKLRRVRWIDPARGLLRIEAEEVVPVLPPRPDGVSSLLHEQVHAIRWDFEDAVLWVQAPGAMLSEPDVVASLAAIAERIDDAHSGLRVLLPAEVMEPSFEPWSSSVELSVPRDPALTSFVEALLPRALAATRAPEDVAGVLRGLDAPSIARTVAATFRDESVDYVLDKRLLLETLRSRRDLLLRRAAGVEVVGDRVSGSEVGGLQYLKRYLEYRRKIFSDIERAREEGVDVPRGVLLIGLPGCGKSLAAKMAAELMQMPLLRLDVGALMGGLVGQSEENLRDALATAEAAAPCVLWVDELEKALGALTGEGDGGTGKRMLAHMLTWMQEQRAQVYVFATANAVDALPPELLRRGRFDELFSVGLPNDDEVEEILEIHLRRRKMLDGISVRDAARLLEGFTGADIEAVVSEARARSFATGEALDLELLRQILADFTPLTRQFSGRIEAMKKELESHGFRDASARDLPPPPQDDGTVPLPRQLRKLLESDDVHVATVRSPGVFTIQLSGATCFLARGEHTRITAASAEVELRLGERGGALVSTQVSSDAGLWPAPLPALDAQHTFALVEYDGQLTLRYEDATRTQRDVVLALKAHESTRRIVPDQLVRLAAGVATPPPIELASGRKLILTPTRGVASVDYLVREQGANAPSAVMKTTLTVDAVVLTLIHLFEGVDAAVAEELEAGWEVRSERESLVTTPSRRGIGKLVGVSQRAQAPAPPFVYEFEAHNLMQRVRVPDNRKAVLSVFRLGRWIAIATGNAQRQGDTVWEIRCTTRKVKGYSVPGSIRFEHHCQRSMPIISVWVDGALQSTARIVG